MKRFSAITVASAICLLIGVSCEAAGPDEDLSLDAVNSPLPEYGMVRGPEGYYFARKDAPFGKPGKEQIYRIDQHGAISQPDWASPDRSEGDPYFSSDMTQACFVSDRAGNPDIWCVALNKRDSTAYRLPEPINSPGNEYSPVLAADGSIYFASDREGGFGLGDLYRAKQTDDEWSVENLGATINGPGGEWNLDLSPDGQALVFEASHRETNKSVSGDLYLSRRSADGWSAPVPLTHLNTKGSDLMPRFVSDDEFIYASGGPDDVDLFRAKLNPENLSR